MIFNRLKQNLRRLEKQVQSPKNTRKLVAIAMVGIFLLFVLSVYIFIMDLTMGITTEQEDLLLRAQTYHSTETKAQPDATEEAESNSFVKPHGGATPIPRMNHQN